MNLKSPNKLHINPPTTLMNFLVSPFDLSFISLIAVDLYQIEGGALQTSSNCNIYLDSVSEPVVTICGSCIYDWHHRHHPTTGPTCPTCKSPMSNASLIPLHGQGSHQQAQHPQLAFSHELPGSRGEEDHHLVMSNYSNYGTWVDDGNFRNYCRLAGFSIRLKYDCQRLYEYDAREGIWIEMWLRLLFSVLLVLAALCTLWF